MSKSNHFSTQSVFGQLISLIDEGLIGKEVKKCDSDRYTKRFKTKDHLISMLFCSFSKCTSLREISGAMLGLSVKMAGFRLNHIPKRSTLYDYVFDKGYNDYKAFKHFTSQNTGLVTRIKDNASYLKIEKLDIESHIHSGG
ncbi:DUF4372 domain-containing protein [Chryseobacterium cucumeris]|uniref:DUF4372 domain-containing protein n=1 Tax=Chryseobacterium TaxID=59732 RepID=UPI0028832246|nr:DUF4372 domain-containing protein [Chryseobacterium sp. SG20098]WNI35956.1 DUF4372 domain-containing protein [Chryseobacterium sp. SG20098]WNI36550.1 DUF4372 domain-containing protein [Chryseobacterium sp. SG20098]